MSQPRHWPERLRQREASLSSLSFFFSLLLWTSIYFTGLRDIIHGSVGWLVILSLWFVTFLCSRPAAKRTAFNNILKHQKEIVMLFIWSLIVFITFLSERGNQETIYVYVSNTIVLWVVYLMAIMYLHDDPRRYSVTSISIIIVLAFATILILPPLYSYPSLVREVKTNPNLLEIMEIRWIGSIGFFSGIAIAMPCLFVAALQQKKRKRFLYLLLCAGPVAMILMSTMAAAVYLLLFGLGGLLLFPNMKKQAIKYRIMVFICIFAVITITIFGESEQIDFVKDKTQYIAETLSSDGLSEVERGSDAVASLRTIGESPFWGVGPIERGTYTVIGEHSSWLDGIAEYGFLGFGPYFGFLFFGFRHLWRNARSNRDKLTYHARIVTFVLYLTQGLINPWAFDSTAMTLFLILAMAPEKSE